LAGTQKESWWLKKEIVFEPCVVFDDLVGHRQSNKEAYQMKFLRRPQVERLTGLSRSSIYAMVADGRFPRQVKISRRAVAWREADIFEWMNNKSDI
jgi:prophage regulatory protein